MSRRAANAHRRRMIAYGRWAPFVDAAPARDHLDLLSRHRIGWARAAELAGLSRGTVSHILFTPRRVERIRPETEAAILAVQPSGEVVAPGARVPAIGTQRRIQALHAIGWTLSDVAAGIDADRRNFGRIFDQDEVRAETAQAVRDLYRRAWDRPPAEDTPTAAYWARRAREDAAERGWAPPMAWDDDAIDLPEGRPAKGWQRTRTSWRTADLVADVAELEGQGYRREDAARRLGVTRDAVDKAVSRTRGRELEAAS
jgi:hypothetical protein